MLGVRKMARDAVILVDSDGAPMVQRVRPLDRVRARLLARALDRALAAGAPSESEAAVALRARRLTEISKRAELARTLSQLVNRARQASSPTSQAPIARRAVLSATEELSELASELVAPGPVGAGGVAQVQLLISDGTGPLYNPQSGIDLTTAVRRAIEALQLYRRQPAW
jgi:hypothetical protein